jgi:hypothetical protein
MWVAKVGRDAFLSAREHGSKWDIRVPRRIDAKRASFTTLGRSIGPRENQVSCRGRGIARIRPVPGGTICGTDYFRRNQQPCLDGRET